MLPLLEVLLLLFLLTVHGIRRNELSVEDIKKNPYFQHFPNCTAGYEKISKKTTARAILCPMFRDEEGFLSEWVAYYQMHGFDHIMLFDDGSTDRSLDEVQPWITTGFVSVR